MPNLTGPEYRQIYEHLDEMRAQRVQALSDGSAFVRGDKGMLIDAVNTTVKYAQDLKVIETLEDVLGVIVNLDHERYGSQNKQRINDGDD